MNFADHKQIADFEQVVSEMLHMDLRFALYCYHKDFVELEHFVCCNQIWIADRPGKAVQTGKKELKKLLEEADEKGVDVKKILSED